MADFQHTLMAWLLTYALHSTALIGLVWLGVRCLPKESNLAQERLWKCALLGSIATASLQVGLAYQPLAGQLFLPESELAANSQGEQELQVIEIEESDQNLGLRRSARATLQDSPVLPQAKLAPLPVLELPKDTRKTSRRKASNKRASKKSRSKKASDCASEETNETPAIAASSATESSIVPDPIDSIVESDTGTVAGAFAPRAAKTTSWPFWRRILLVVWAIGGLFGLLCLALAWRRIIDHITGRRELNEGALFDTLQRLANRAGLRRAPRLLVSRKIGSPATLGVLRPQICVPERAISGLSSEQQEAMLGHELGHVVRRDPQWFFLYRLVERVLFFQPLNRIARREIQELAEYQCDDWAVKHTANGLGLARCLTEVAGWMVAERPAVALLPMAGRGSQLGHRVRRLLDEESRQASARRNVWGLPLAIGVFASAAMALPAVTTRQPVLTPDPASIATLPAPDLGPPSVMSPMVTPQPSAPATRSAYPRLNALVEELGTRLQVLQEQINELQTTAQRNGTHAENEEALLHLRLRLLSLRDKQLRMVALLQTQLSPKNTSTHEPKTTHRGQE